MTKLRVAIVGTGFAGPVHAEAARRNHRLAHVQIIAGVSDLDARTAAEAMDIPEYTGDYTTILDRDDIDVVHICTPNYLHYPMVKEFLEHGKHVICEKPLALNSQQAHSLMAIAKEKNLKSAVNYNLRYYPMVQELKARNDEREGGRIFALQGSYLQDWLLNETDYSWRLESDLNGASRAVADIGTHWMDMAQYVTSSKIVKVYAQFGQMYDTRKKSQAGNDLTFQKGSKKDTSEYVSYTVNTEDYAQILLAFDNGSMGNLTVSQVSAGYKNYMEIRQFSTQAAYTWNSESPNLLKIGHRDQPNEMLLKDPSLLHPSAARTSQYPGGHQEGYGDTFKYLLRSFYSDLLGIEGGGDYPTLEDGTAEMVLCEAIIKSMQEGAWVTVQGTNGEMA